MLESVIAGYIWEVLLTLAVAFGSVVWSSTNKRIDKLEQVQTKTNDELQVVKVDYVRKEDLHQIQSQLDLRFQEMRNFFTEILRKQNG
jgi:activator of 2-hydroxyglutaryl-CoA dehydratase